MYYTRTSSSYRGSRAERQLELPSLADALAAVARRFWIFPAAPYAKTPHPDVRSWADAATNDPDEIRERGWPKNANIAIACKPSGLLVVDLDQHEHDGVAAFTELAARAHHERYKCNRKYCTGHWPDTYIVQTPTDGFHLVFLNPDPDRYGNSTGSLPKGIDVRGGGEKRAATCSPPDQWSTAGRTRASPPSFRSWLAKASRTRCTTTPR